MKKSELFRLFREYFDTEIRDIVKEIVTEELKKAIKKVTTNSSFRDLIKDDDFSNTFVENKRPNKKKTVKKSELQLFNGNSQIDQLLNEVLNRKMAAQKENEIYKNEMPVFDKRLFISKNVLDNKKQLQISNTSNDKLTEDVIKQKQQIRDMYMNIVNENADIDEKMEYDNDTLNTDVEGIIPLDRNDASIPIELRKVFTRDYSQLVKSFSKKRNKNNENNE